MTQRTKQGGTTPRLDALRRAYAQRMAKDEPPESRAERAFRAASRMLGRDVRPVPASE